MVVMLQNPMPKSMSLVILSYDYLEDWVDIHKIVDWMLDNKEDAGCAWDCIRNDEILAF